MLGVSLAVQRENHTNGPPVITRFRVGHASSMGSRSSEESGQTTLIGTRSKSGMGLPGVQNGASLALSALPDNCPADPYKNDSHRQCL